MKWQKLIPGSYTVFRERRRWHPKRLLRKESLIPQRGALRSVRFLECSLSFKPPVNNDIMASLKVTWNQKLFNISSTLSCYLRDYTGY